MILTIAPRSHYMILCDEVLRDEDAGKQAVNRGLNVPRDLARGNLRSVRLEKLVILLVLTDGHGTGMGRITCVNEETGAPIFAIAAAGIILCGQRCLRALWRHLQGS